MDLNQLVNDLLATEQYDTEASACWQAGNYEGYQEKKNEKSTKVMELLTGSGIVVTVEGTKNLGRCYNAAYYKITSQVEPPDGILMALRKAGLLGYGQEFYFGKFVWSEENNTFVAKAESRVDSSD